MEVINAVIMLYRRLQRRRRERRHLLLFNAVQRRGPYNEITDNPIEINNILTGNERATRKHLRISRQSLMHLFHLYPEKPQGWSKEYEVIVFLYWLACGTSYRIVAVTFGIPRTTAYNMINRKLNQTVALARNLIKLPHMQDLEAIGNGFVNLARSQAFRYCAGAIDGCHVRITCPTVLHDQYINRKLFYSIQLQAVCDNTGKFIDLFTGFPGSVHDSRVLRYSNIYRNSLYPPQNHYLLGDGGYPNITNPIAIITPYRGNNLLHEQIAFNTHHARARNVIERAFGMMKTRWRSIFTKALELSISKCTKTIVSCVLLHNVCITNGDIFNVMIDPLPIPHNEGENQEVANDLRDQIMHMI